MLTELLGIILIVLVMIIVIVRRQMLKAKLDRVEIDDSVDVLQMRLEDAADHIIERMEEHIDQLEFLIAEADKKIAILDGRIEEIKTLSARGVLDVDQKPMILSEERLGKPTKLRDSLALGFSKEAGHEAKDKKKLILKPSKMNQSVLEMLNSGQTIDEISKKTGIGKGAILLIQEMYGSAHM